MEIFLGADERPPASELEICKVDLIILVVRFQGSQEIGCIKFFLLFLQETFDQIDLEYRKIRGWVFLEPLFQLV